MEKKSLEDMLHEKQESLEVGKSYLHLLPQNTLIPEVCVVWAVFLCTFAMFLVSAC